MRKSRLFTLMLSLLLMSSTVLATHFWEGTINQLWNNPGNWDMGTVPGSGDDVIIPSGTTHDCWVSSADQACHNLFVMGGAHFRVYDQLLYVHGLMQIWGQLKMDNYNGMVIVTGDIKWESGSTALITAYAGIRTYANWEFKSGSNVHMDDGYVQMFGYGTTEIKCLSSNSYMHTLVIGCPSGDQVAFSGSSTADLVLHGDLAITTGSKFISSSVHDIVLNGEITYNNGHFNFYGGNFIFNGTPSYVRCNSGDYFNNLIINSAGEISMLSNLDINGDLTINSGKLKTNSYTMRVVGDWLDNNRPNGFDPGTGTVILYGVGNQVCYGDNFYILQVDKLSSSGIASLSPDPGNPLTPCTASSKIDILDGTFKLNTNAIFNPANVVIHTGGYLDTYGATGVHINLSQSWLDYNSPYSGFGYGTSEILFSGSGNQSINVSAPLYGFYDIHVNKPANNVTSLDGILIHGTLWIEAGDWVGSAAASTRMYYGDILIEGGGFHEDCPTWFVGTDDQNISLISSSGQDFGPMTISKTSDDKSKGSSVTITGDQTLYTTGKITVAEGTLQLQNGKIYCNNDLEVQSGGLFGLMDGSTLELAGTSTLSVNSGGIFQSIGTAAAENTITKHAYSSGNFSFQVESGGLIRAKHSVFQYMDIGGINVLYGAYVDTDYPFDYCTFQYGESGGKLLQLNCSQNLNIANAVFPTNNGGYNVGRSNNLGVITFSWASGLFAGEAYDSDPNNVVNWNNDPTYLSGKVFLEGAWDMTSMQSDLNSVVPLSQPYGTFPWNYYGTENVASMPSPAVVDWVLLELRTTDYGASSATSDGRVARHAALLLDNGVIQNTDGTYTIPFETAVGVTDNLYLVAYHHNHIPVMSANPLVESAGVYNCDLSTNGAIYGGTLGSKYLGATIYGMIAGDANADGSIDLNDLTPWNLSAGLYGYLQSDLNMNTEVDNVDKNDFVVPNMGKTSQVP